MRVATPGITALSQLTIDADLDMAGTYQVKDLAAPADGEALRKGNKDIANAEVADAAAIAVAKLEDTVCTKALADSKIATHKADASAHHSKLAFVPLDPDQAHANPNDASWEDWDLSGEVPEGALYVLIYMINGSTTTVRNGGVRENGSAFDNYNPVPSWGVIVGTSTEWGVSCIVPCDANRIVETKASSKTELKFNCGGYFI